MNKVEVIFKIDNIVKKTILSKDVFIIGRSTSCDVVLQSEGISRKHLKCYIKNEDIVISDLESVYGSYLNKKKLISEKQYLYHKKSLTIGSKHIEIAIRILSSDQESQGTESLHEARPINFEREIIKNKIKKSLIPPSKEEQDLQNLEKQKMQLEIKREVLELENENKKLQNEKDSFKILDEAKSEASKIKQTARQMADSHYHELDEILSKRELDLIEKETTYDKELLKNLENKDLLEKNINELEQEYFLKNNQKELLEQNLKKIKSKVDLEEIDLNQKKVLINNEKIEIESDYLLLQKNLEDKEREFNILVETIISDKKSYQEALVSHENQLSSLKKNHKDLDLSLEIKKCDKTTLTQEINSIHFEISNHKSKKEKLEYEISQLKKDIYKSDLNTKKEAKNIIKKALNEAEKIDNMAKETQKKLIDKEKQINTYKNEAYLKADEYYKNRINESDSLFEKKSILAEQKYQVQQEENNHKIKQIKNQAEESHKEELLLFNQLKIEKESQIEKWVKKEKSLAIENCNIKEEKANQYYGMRINNADQYFEEKRIQSEAYYHEKIDHINKEHQDISFNIERLKSDDNKLKLRKETLLKKIENLESKKDIIEKECAIEKKNVRDDIEKMRVDSMARIDKTIATAKESADLIMSTTLRSSQEAQRKSNELLDEEIASRKKDSNLYIEQMIKDANNKAQEIITDAKNDTQIIKRDISDSIICQKADHEKDIRKRNQKHREGQQLILTEYKEKSNLVLKKEGLQLIELEREQEALLILSQDKIKTNLLILKELNDKYDNDKTDMIKNIEGERIKRFSQLDTQIEEASQNAQKEIERLRLKESDKVNNIMKIKLEKEKSRINANIKSITSNITHLIEQNLSEVQKKDVLNILTSDLLTSLVSKSFDIEDPIHNKKVQNFIPFNLEAETLAKKAYIKIASIASVAGIIISIIISNPSIFSDIKEGTINSISLKKSSTESIIEEIELKNKNKPKFNPKRDSKFRDNYTDKIIYTQDYRETISSQDFKKKWIIALNNFMTHKLLLPDNSIISFIAIESKLKSDLIKNFHKINPNYKDKAISRMKSVEKVSKSPLMKVFKTIENWKKFRNFQKNYFQTYNTNRLPASKKSGK